MQTNTTNSITTTTLSEPASLATVRAAYLRRRRVDPVRAAVLADLAFATSPVWVGGRA